MSACRAGGMRCGGCARGHVCVGGGQLPSGTHRGARWLHLPHHKFGLECGKSGAEGRRRRHSLILRVEGQGCGRLNLACPTTHAMRRSLAPPVCTRCRRKACCGPWT
eukprot:365964-Chlamydomonas_euryale.AAC.3